MIAAKKARARGAVPENSSASKDPKYYLRAIGKALEVLTIVKSSPRPLSFNDLVRKVKLVKSSLFRIVYTLEAEGYLRRVEGGLYEIPPDIGPLVDRQLTQKLAHAAAPWMAQLSREFRETISLGVLMTNHVEVIAAVESLELMRMSSVVGRILPPHASSLGKSITAFQPEPLREKLVRNYGLSRFTPATITDEVQLREEFSRIRAAGYSPDLEETTIGGCCFGAPIWIRGDSVLGGISVSLPKIRLAERQPDLIRGVQAAAKAIGAALG